MTLLLRLSMLSQQCSTQAMQTPLWLLEPLGGALESDIAWLLRGVLGTLAAFVKADWMNIIGFVVSSIHFSIPSVSESKGTSASKDP